MGRGWAKGGGSLFYLATSFTLLKYMILWCKIQVMIYPLLRILEDKDDTFHEFRVEKDLTELLN